MFLEVSDTHTPLQHRKVKSYKVPCSWLTSNIKELINTRDKLKRKAIITKSETDWKNYKLARNRTNIEIRKVKSECYCWRIADQNSNLKEAWKTINNLLGRNCKTTSVMNEI